MQQLFRLGQMFKPVTSVEQYAPLLRAVFAELQRMPEPPEGGDPSSPEVVQYLKDRSAHWERLNARRLEFEAVRPDPRLSRVHEESVKFIRANLTVLNILAESTVAVMNGDLALMQRKEREAESWAPVLESVSGKLGRALKNVQGEQPTMFKMLGLPPDLLAEFGLYGSD